MIDPQLAALAPLLGETPERAAYLDGPDALFASALAYAEAGWPIFPLTPGGKTPATTHGVDDATVDPERILAWWGANPSYNIGAATGHRFDVIDIDMPDGPASWASFIDELATAGHTLPELLAAARTGSDGTHLFVLAVAGARNGVGLGGRRGLDYRARGGYVVIPPSRLDGKKRYRWSVEPDGRLLEGTSR